MVPEHRQPGGAAPGEAGQPGGDQGHHHVELLLDGQRPVVLHHARLQVVGAVGGALDDEAPVGHVERGGGHVSGQGAQLVGVAGHRGHGHRHGQTHQGGREQPAEAPAPEPGQPDAPGALALAQQQRGDEVAGEHEEDRDAQEAAGEQVGGEVVDDDGGHGQAPQAVEGRHPVGVRRRVGRGGRVTRARPARVAPRRPALGRPVSEPARVAVLRLTHPQHALQDARPPAPAPTPRTRCPHARPEQRSGRAGRWRA